MMKREAALVQFILFTNMIVKNEILLQSTLNVYGPLLSLDRRDRLWFTSFKSISR